MKGLEALRSVVRRPYTFPGAYARRVVLDDGETLCNECLRGEYRELYRATRDQDGNGWEVIGEFVHWEGAPLFCAHCGAEVESEYGDPEREEE